MMVCLAGVMDSMMEVLESYANHLEEKVAERTGELDTANKALENLLHQVANSSYTVDSSYCATDQRNFSLFR